MPEKNLILAMALLLSGAVAFAEEQSNQLQATNASQSGASAQKDPMRDAMGVQTPVSEPRTLVAPEIRPIAPIGEPDAGAQDSTFRTYRGLWAAILGGTVGLVILSLIFMILTEEGAPPEDMQ